MIKLTKLYELLKERLSNSNFEGLLSSIVTSKLLEIQVSNYSKYTNKILVTYDDDPPSKIIITDTDGTQIESDDPLDELFNIVTHHYDELRGDNND